MLAAVDRGRVSPMDSREFLRQWFETGKITMREASLKLGRSHSYLQQYIERGVPRRLGEDDRKALAEILDIDEANLKDQIGAVSSRSAAPPREAPRSEVDFARKMPVADGPRDLPVYGTVKGGKEGEFVDTSKILARVARPDYLAGVDNAFAMYVIGDSMSPRFRRGDLLFIRPGRPPNRGDEVVIAFQDNTGLVKIYVGADGRACEVEQLNPRRKLKFPLAEIAGIYLVKGLERP